MSTSSESDLLAAVIEALRARGVRFQEVEADPPTLRLGHEGRSGRWAWYVRVDPEDRVVAVFSVFPWDAAPERRAAACECLTRINSGLALATFELDLADGEILCRTAVSARGAALSPALVEGLIEGNLQAMDVYFPALVEVLAGGEPAEAVARAEALDSELEA